jgi:hypothetical protein
LELARCLSICRFALYPFGPRCGLFRGLSRQQLLHRQRVLFGLPLPSRHDLG